MLGNSGVTIRDSQGAVHNAPLFFASSGQINFLVPPAVSLGMATAAVAIGGQTIAFGPMRVNRVAPSLFTADASGKGVAAAQYLRAGQSGARNIDLIFHPSTLAPVPVDLGGESDSVFLMLYGTGLRRFSAAPTATIGGQPVPLSGPVAHSIYVGLDQINLGPIPRSLAGKGLVEILVSVDGQRANAVTVSMR